jgi:hypothetical protein
MPNYSETGHAKNVANLQDLIAFVTGYGAIYNPTKTALKLTALQTLNTTANTHLADVVTKKTAFNNVVNARFQAFDGLKPLSTRLVNALEITDASTEKIKDAKGFNRKLQGKRASTPTAPIDPNAPIPPTISASQQSYDQQIQHLAGLISVLQSEASYTPNETDLKTVTLLAKQTDLTAKNSAVATAYATISNARITRDNTLYNQNTGLVDIATEVKKYIKTIFGATSSEYAQVKGLQFKQVKK